MPAARVVQFDCPACGDLIELHNVDKEFVKVMITEMNVDIGRGKSLTQCQLEALKFALLAHLDPGEEIVTIQEVHRALDHQALTTGTADDAGEGEGQGTPGAR